MTITASDLTAGTFVEAILVGEWACPVGATVVAVGPLPTWDQVLVSFDDGEHWPVGLDRTIVVR